MQNGKDKINNTALGTAPDRRVGSVAPCYGGFMPLNCTRCSGTGFLNIEQVDGETLKIFEESGNEQIILNWIVITPDHDVQVCDCCGNGEVWYGMRGEHYNHDDPRGQYGPYAYNGGLCECN